MKRLKEGNLTIGRCKRRLPATLDQFHAPQFIGAVEIGIICQMMHSAAWIISTHPQYSAEEKKLFGDIAALAHYATNEPFLRFPRRVGDALINASADACRIISADVFAGQPVKDLSYFYTLYFWLSDVIEAGIVTLHGGTAFDAAWDLVKGWMLEPAREETLPLVEKSCRKRARKFSDVLAQYGLFVHQHQEMAA